MCMAVDIFGNADVQFVVPFTGKFRYCNMANKDRALCVTITEGYFESSSLEAIATLRLYFSRIPDRFRVVGGIDGVRLINGNIVYRLRLSFLSFKNLLLVLRHFRIGLTIPSNFIVSIRQLNIARKDMANLKAVCSVIELSLMEWLTNSISVQLILLCEYLGIKCTTTRSREELFSRRLLHRSPYICGGISADYLSSSIMVVPFKYLLDTNLVELVGRDSEGYLLRVGNGTILITGFTKKNLKFYRGRK